MHIFKFSVLLYYIQGLVIELTNKNNKYFSVLNLVNTLQISLDVIGYLGHFDPSQITSS